jgi:mannose-6-phosphate isomerase-like protein (cupin superfamily)
MNDIKDQGPNPLVVDIEELTVQNTNYRTTLWTGNNLQVTLMTIQPGKEIGLEAHPDHDQFLRIEQGQATVYMGVAKDQLRTWQSNNGDAVIVPAGMWHNLVNDGDMSIKLYSIYAPVQHPHGTVHVTKEDAEQSE